MEMYPVWSAVVDNKFTIMAMTGWGVFTLDQFNTIEEYGAWLKSMTELYTQHNIPIPEYIRRAFET